MTFEEMQLLLQSISIAQRESAIAQRETAAAQRETQAIVDSNAHAIQAMLDQAATDRLRGCLESINRHQ
jgi:hypothetical protein